MNKEELEKIHDKCFENKEALSKVNKCGCMNCLRIFNPKEIKEWINFSNGPTAFCPYCFIDSVIPESNEYALDESLLKELHEYYFKRTYELNDILESIHTTELGLERIRKNLELDNNIDVIEFIKDKLLDDNCKLSKKGKNYYCEIDNTIVTINSYSYTIITAHKKEK